MKKNHWFAGFSVALTVSAASPAHAQSTSQSCSADANVCQQTCAGIGLYGALRRDAEASKKMEKCNSHCEAEKASCERKVAGVAEPRANPPTPTPTPSTPPSSPTPPPVSGGPGAGQGGQAPAPKQVETTFELPAENQCASYYLIKEYPETQMSLRKLQFGIRNLCSYPVRIGWTAYRNNRETIMIDYQWHGAERGEFPPGSRVESLPFVVSRDHFHVRIRTVCLTKAEIIRRTGKKVVGVTAHFEKPVCTVHLERPPVGVAN